MREFFQENKKIAKTIKEVADLANYLWQKGWAERNAGNISVNLSELMADTQFELEHYPMFQLERSYEALSDLYFFVTGTGKRMRDLAISPMKNACIIKMNKKGNAYHIISMKKRNLYNFRPTSELPTHLAVHNLLVRSGSKNKAVVHTHPNELVAMTQIPRFQTAEMLNKTLWGMHPEAFVFVPRGVYMVPYILPGSHKIADATIKGFEKGHDVVIWEKHGAFAIGETVSDAFDMIDILSKSAQIWFMAMQTGTEPEGLNDEQLLELKEAFLKK
jgi:rhamnulose-1-phosphate aldolase